MELNFKLYNRGRTKFKNYRTSIFKKLKYSGKKIFAE